MALRAGRAANVVVPGTVPDLRARTAATEIALNPMVSGSGSNIKMFEYLAAGLPVVSTAFGARGAPDPSGSTIVVCECEEFAEHIDRLSSDPRLAQRRRAARKLVEQNSDWSAISASVVAHIEGMTGTCNL